MIFPAKGTSMNYVQLGMDFDGGKTLYLRVPTVWDYLDQQWIGFIKTPKTQRLIAAKGEDSLKMHESFNGAIKALLGDSESRDEVYSMFKPLSYWRKIGIHD